MSRTYEQVAAKRLALGDLFVKHASREDAQEHGYAWRVLAHDLTARGDYSTVVECDGSDWTERFEPDEPVWLVSDD
jgi:hypothetical protein